MTTIGLVAEGTLDYPVISAFLDANLAASFPRPLTYRMLQPLPDATSGGFLGGGWPRVVSWCLANSGSKIETYFNSLEEDDDPCDLIIVHLDADAMIPCSSHSSEPVPDEPCSIEERLGAMVRFVERWLDLPASRTAQVRFAFPAMHSEAWLLAALRPDEMIWEQEPDSKSPFRALRAAGSGSMAKFYDEKAKEAAAQSGTVARQSVSFSRFISAVR